MIKFIESIIDFDMMIDSIKKHDVIILPTLTDSKQHYCNNSLSLLYIKDILNRDEYVVGVDHPDFTFRMVERLQEITARQIYTLDQKKLLTWISHDNIVDVNMQYYLYHNDIPDWKEETPTHVFYNRKFEGQSNLNKIIPVTKHIEIHQENSDKIITLLGNLNFPKALNVYTLMGRITYRAEQSGILTDPDLLSQHYPKAVTKNNLLYCDYNFYTSTGRPSNAFGGVNFAAINKTDGSRRCFIPRYDTFLLSDFDSYHLNLIARIIGYEFEEKNIHKYLGRYYFGKDDLTDKEYEESKRMNFVYLYNGIPKVVRDAIPYFEKVQDLVYDMWRSMQRNGWYESPLTKRKIYMKHIENPSATKVFNYFIQQLETESNMVIMNRLLNFLDDYKTKLVLYTYDSFLFDYANDDGVECVMGIKDILDSFPNKMYIGKNYQDMVDMTKKFSEKAKSF